MSECIGSDPNKDFSLNFINQGCEQFGNPDGMNGSCHYCKELNSKRFNDCVEVKNLKIFRKDYKIYKERQ